MSRLERVEALRGAATERFGENNPNVDSFMSAPSAAMGGVTPEQSAASSDSGLQTARTLLQNTQG